MDKVDTRKMISPKRACDIYDIAPGTLANLRTARRGPKYFKVGAKVLYNLADLEAYFTARPIVTIDTLPEAH
jgi:hypothetical protein